ncbi:hypothetical protein FB451DRAFT_1176855 [Mycena latifolia]|nr:hypothetical protein FB451DRAFT_1176855 [Mycena latifolia]
MPARVKTSAVEGSKQLYAIWGCRIWLVYGRTRATALVANLPDLSANSRRSCRGVVRNRGARDTEGQHQGISGRLGGDRNEAFSGGKADQQSRELTLLTDNDSDENITVGDDAIKPADRQSREEAVTALERARGRHLGVFHGLAAARVYEIIDQYNGEPKYEW